MSEQSSVRTIDRPAPGRENCTNPIEWGPCRCCEAGVCDCGAESQCSCAPCYGGSEGATQSDLFDPERLRVFAVDVTHSYRTYVFAQTAEDAGAIGGAHAGEDRELGVESTGYGTQELTAPLPVADDMPAWGPVRWGRRALTVNEALRLIGSPRQAPPTVATDELRPVDGWDWVRLAAAASDYNPVLRYVSVSGGVAVATDRKRLHLAPVSRPDGLWDAELMEPAAGEFPPYRHLLDREGPVMEVCDLPALWEVLRAARPGTVEVPCGIYRATLDADQFTEAVLGGASAGRIVLSAACGHTAVRLDIPDLGRTAVLARMVGRHPSADLSLYVRPPEPGVTVR